MFVPLVNPGFGKPARVRLKFKKSCLGYFFGHALKLLKSSKKVVCFFAFFAGFEVARGHASLAVACFVDSISNKERHQKYTTCFPVIAMQPHNDTIPRITRTRATAIVFDHALGCVEQLSFRFRAVGRYKGLHCCVAAL